MKPQKAMEKTVSASTPTRRAPPHGQSHAGDDSHQEHHAVTANGQPNVVGDARQNQPDRGANHQKHREVAARVVVEALFADEPDDEPQAERGPGGQEQSEAEHGQARHFVGNPEERL